MSYQRYNHGKIHSTECIIANACHVGGNGDGGQAGASIESPTANSLHAVGQSDVSHRGQENL